MQATRLGAPVYRDACKALPPIPSNTEYRATLLSKFATALAAGCDILSIRGASQHARHAATNREQHATVGSRATDLSAYGHLLLHFSTLTRLEAINLRRRPQSFAVASACA